MSHPDFAFRVDDETRLWVLYRQTKTQERPVVVRTRERTFWFGQDRETGNGDREAVRDDFLDAVGALFLRGLAGRDWVLEPIFEALTWYEAECIDELRELRNESSSARSSPDVRAELRKKGHEIPENPRSMPSEAGDLVKAARSHFTLTDSRAFKLGEGGSHDRRGEHPDETDLSEFGSM